MPGLVPGIHVLLHLSGKDVDGRDKPGHDKKRDSFSNFWRESENVGLLFWIRCSR